MKEGHLLGQILVERGMLAGDQLARALERQAVTGRRLGEVLVEMRALGETALRWALAEQMDLPLVHPDPGAVDPEAVALLPAGLCRRYGVLPLYLSEDVPGGPLVLTLAAADPASRELLEDVAARVRRPVRVMPAMREEILAALDVLHGPSEPGDESIRDCGVSPEDLPAVRADPTGGALLDKLLGRLVEQGRGGFHFRARGGESCVDDLEGRPVFRGGEIWHGVLLDRLRRHARLLPPAGEAIQRGRFGWGPPGADALFRVTVLRGSEGEEAEVKLVEREGRPRSLEELGFEEDQARQVRGVLQEPGLVWITALDQEGVATTLFSVLRAVPGSGRGITVEEEVCYRSPDLLQVETLGVDAQGRTRLLQEVRTLSFERVVVDRVAPSLLPELLAIAGRRRWVLAATIGMTPDEALQALARCGSDVPLTGLRALIHQRMVRRLCPACRVEASARDGQEGVPEGPAGFRGPWFEAGPGCRQCGGGGFRGRRAVFDVLPVDAEFREALRGAAHGENRWRERLRENRPGLRDLLRKAAAAGEVAVSELRDAF